MKRFLGLLLALAGAALIVMAVSSLLMTKSTIYGYHAMYPGLLGLGLFTVGLLYRQE